MSRGQFYIRLSQVKELIYNYAYPEPLPLYLRRYFRANKKLGSRDRKQITQWVYAYFKSDVLITDLETELLYLLEQDESSILEHLSVQSSFNFSGKPEHRLFPLSKAISRQLPEDCLAHLKSEKLTWVRSGKPLNDVGVKFSDQIYGLEQGRPIPEESYDQIQDLASFLASKKIADSLQFVSGTGALAFWDACCGSGGKSLAIRSQLNTDGKEYKWYCSDKRSHILENAKKRLKKEKSIQYDQIDLSQKLDLPLFGKEEVALASFDAILLDVPCSGSGTWGRNPQHLRFFDQSQLNEYVQLQRLILKNALPMLRKNGSLFFITCSVYTSENEEQLNWLMESFDLDLMSQTYLGKPTSDVIYWSHLIKKS